MHHKYQTEGLVISGVGSGERSRKIWLFGREVGLVVGKVQAGRALQSKLRGAVQDFTMGTFSLVRGKSEWKVVGARASGNIFESVRSEPEKIKVAASILNLIKKLVEEGRETHELFDAVKDFITHLPDIPLQELKSAECLILLRILHKLGFLRADPDLVICLEEKGITQTALTTVQTHKQKTIQLINESLHAAEMRK